MFAVQIFGADLGAFFRAKFPWCVLLRVKY